MEGGAFAAGRAGAGGLVLIGRELHFFGGLETDGKTDSSDHWVLNLDNVSAGWSSRAAMPDPRNHIGYAGLNGKIYAIGGQHALDEKTGLDATVNVYDPATDQWSSVAPLPQVRSHLHNSTFVSGGKIYCVGGTDAGDLSSDQILQYDPSLNQWAVVGHLPAPRSATVAQLVNGELIDTTGTPTGVLPQATTFTIPLSALSATPPGGTTGTPPSDVSIRLASSTPVGATAGRKSKARVIIANAAGGGPVDGDVTVQLYLSSDGAIDASSPLLGTVTRDLKLKPSHSKLFAINFRWPAAAATGQYQLMAQMVPAGSEAASLPADSVATSAPFPLAAAGIDLVPAITTPAGTFAAGRTMFATLTLQNSGNIALNGPVSLAISATASPGTPTPGTSPATTNLLVITRPFHLPPRAARRLRVRVPLPSSLAAGTYVATVIADPGNLLAELDKSNNTAASPTPITIG